MKTTLILLLSLVLKLSAEPLYLVFNEPTNNASVGATKYIAFWQTNNVATSFGSCPVGNTFIAFDSTNLPSQCTVSVVTTDGVNYSASSTPLNYVNGQFVLQPVTFPHIQKNHP